MAHVKRFKKKTIEDHEALQWLPGDPSALDTLQWLWDHNIWVITKPDGSLHLQALGSLLVVNATDWIVRNTDTGMVAIIPDTDFVGAYDEVIEPAPTPA